MHFGKSWIVPASWSSTDRKQRPGERFLATMVHGKTHTYANYARICIIQLSQVFDSTMESNLQP